jgi:hypothetical protein
MGGLSLEVAMLHNLPIPKEFSETILDRLNERWSYQLRMMTAEEQFYCVELLKFTAHEVTSKNIHYLALKVRLERWLTGKENNLFSQADWDSLAKIYQERFLRFCMRLNQERLDAPASDDSVENLKRQWSGPGSVRWSP